MMKMRKALAVFFPALLAVVRIGAAAFFGLRIYDTRRQDAESERAYGEMSQYVAPCKKEPGEAAVPETPSPGGGLQEDAPRILDIDFAALKEASPDLVGWLYCPDTAVSYPLVQGQDNSITCPIWLTGAKTGTAVCLWTAKTGGICRMRIP